MRDSQLDAAGETVADKGAAACCYSESVKGWIRDPAGLSWETLVAFCAMTGYGEHRKLLGLCCEPESASGETPSSKVPGDSYEPGAAKARAAECRGRPARVCPCTD